LYATAVKSTVRVIAKNSLGSGVVYKEEGNYAYILTNAHVLTDVSNTDNYSSIEIVFSNYVRVKGTYIYLDKNEDVAVISVPKSDNYTVAKIVSSDTDTKVGEEVLAIGNPSGIYFSASYGKISATKIKTTTDYISGTSATTTYVYNSDATLNGGNSGGPLFNSNGEVIAINTMRPTDETNTRDFNYSIPINHFIKVADYIVSNRTSYSRAYLNIEGKSICDYSTSEIATLGITVKTGVYVTSSSETEVSRGRIITQVNGASVATLSDYEYELLKYSKNETITLTTVDISGNNSRTINLRLR
jgi:serine protease Do